MIHYFSLRGVDGGGDISATYEYSFSSGLPDYLEGMAITPEGNFVLGTGEEDKRVFVCGGDPGPGGTLQCDGGTVVRQAEASSIGTYCEGGQMKYSVSADEGSITRGFSDLADVGGEGEFEWRSNLGADEAVEIIGNYVFAGYDPEENQFNEIHVFGLGDKCMDSDGDGDFDSSDLVHSFQQGTYEQDADCIDVETHEPCVADTYNCRCMNLPGDCNRDYRFNSSDFTAAFQMGHYEG